MPITPRHSRRELPPSLVDTTRADAPLPFGRPAIAITPETALAQFVEAKRAENKADRTWENYHKVGTLFLRYLAQQGIDNAWDIGARHINGWLAELRASPSPYTGRTLSPHSVANYGRHILVTCHWLERNGLVPSHTTYGVHVPGIQRSQQPRPTTFTTEEIDTLFAYCAEGDGPGELEALTQRNTALLAVMLETGVRLGELLSMRVEDVQFNPAVVRVTHSKTQPRPLGIGRMRTPAYLRAYVQRARPWLASASADPEHITPTSGPLWLNRDGGPLKHSGVQQLFKRIQRRGGVAARTSPQVCRRFAITHQLMNGMKIEEAALYFATSVNVIQQYYNAISEVELNRKAAQTSVLDTLAREQMLRQNPRGGRSGRGGTFSDG